MSTTFYCVTTVCNTFMYVYLSSLRLCCTNQRQLHISRNCNLPICCSSRGICSLLGSHSAKGIHVYMYIWVYTTKHVIFFICTYLAYYLHKPVVIASVNNTSFMCRKVEIVITILMAQLFILDKLVVAISILQCFNSYAKKNDLQ